MWDEFESDIPDSSDADDTESSDYGDTADDFSEETSDTSIGFGETAEGQWDTDTPFEEDFPEEGVSLTDSGDDTSTSPVGLDQPSEISDDADAPFEEDAIDSDTMLPIADEQDLSSAPANIDSDGEIDDGSDAPFEEDGIGSTDSMPASDDLDESVEPFEEDAFSDSQESDDSMPEEGPVLRRDPEEVAGILERTWLQRAEILRDDLRDKGWEDGPEMEEYVASQVDQWRTEASQDSQTASGSFDTDSTDEPFEEDTISDLASEESDSSGTIGEGVSSDTDGLESFEEDSAPDASPTDSGDEIPGHVNSLDDTAQSTDAMSDSGQSLTEDPTGPYPSGFDYSGVDWNQVYHDIASEQSTDPLRVDSSDSTIDNGGGLLDTMDQAVGGGSPPDNPPDGCDGDDGSGGPPTDNPSDNTDVHSVSDVSKWLGEINPNFDEFDPESPYCNNCGSCAYAVYQRLEGDSTSCASAENIGYNNEMNALTGMEQVSMSPQEIEQRLLNQGEGAHAIIGIDRAEGPGHWFNAACLDGRVVAIDGQTGEITEWPPDYGDVVNWEMSVHKEA